MENRDRLRRQARAELKSLNNTPAVLDTYLETGMSFESAIRAAEEATGIPAETFAAYWKKRKRIADEAAAAKRAQTVLQMTRQGKTDGEIAAYVKIHIKSVSRIRSKMTRHASTSTPS